MWLLLDEFHLIVSQYLLPLFRFILSDCFISPILKEIFVSLRLESMIFLFDFVSLIIICFFGSKDRFVDCDCDARTWKWYFEPFCLINIRRCALNDFFPSLFWAKFTKFTVSARILVHFTWFLRFNQGSTHKTKWNSTEKCFFFVLLRFFFSILKEWKRIFCIFITSTDGFIASHLTCFAGMGIIDSWQ